MNIGTLYRNTHGHYQHSPEFSGDNSRAGVSAHSSTNISQIVPRAFKVELPDLVNTSTGHPVEVEFQINE